MRAWDLTLDGPHRCLQPHLEVDGAQRVVYDLPNLGTHHGYANAGQIVGGALLTGPGRNEAGQQVPELLHPIMVAAQQGAAAAQVALDTKRANAIQVVKNQVTRVKAIAPAARADQDKWLLALSYLVFLEE